MFLDDVMHLPNGTWERVFTHPGDDLRLTGNALKDTGESTYNWFKKKFDNADDILEFLMKWGPTILVAGLVLKAADLLKK